MKVATAFPCSGLSTLLQLGVCMDVAVHFHSQFSLSHDLLAEIVFFFFLNSCVFVFWMPPFLNYHASIIDL